MVNIMFNHKHYVPILKSKTAELSALRDIADKWKANITPLIDVISLPWDYSENKPKKTLKKHLDDTATKISRSWGSDDPVFIDLMYVASNNETVSSKHALNYFWDILLEKNTGIIPVVGTERDENYLAAVELITSSSDTGICLRIEQSDLDDLDTLESVIDALLARFNTAPDECDLIIDFKSIPIQGVGDQISYITTIVNQFPKISRWRTFTIAASSFPQFLKDITADTSKLIPREELSIWRQIVSKKSLRRLPSFGDYAIEYPGMSEADYRKIKIPVSLRYSTPAHWRVFKGREKNRYGHDQFNAICNVLVNSSEYSGAVYSAGDEYISSCANNLDGPGNPQKWRWVGFSHHLTMVSRQIASAALS